MKKYAKSFSVLLIGIIIGGAIVNFINGILIEKITFEKESYKMNNLMLHEKIDKLNESLKSQSYKVVTDITPRVNSSNNKIKIEVEKYIKSKLKDVYGKQIDKVDPDLIFNIFEGRILSIENKKIILKVKYIIINTNIEIYVNTQIKE
ncbi:hypothetical protein [Thermoanaerobacterium sp. RBIITD]|uniref:hypothetical protein n=1 Tax=Thermoanaerobacterium sp. RBIITD TaxID=1550240 RepID=UPI000BB757D5|nr:hypothetical protein [Thermoanaerobacterium sp. RBIITD]SNX54745.1 hypothetical protein SAMN05660242_2459 [Thermoanaerobacterium sp. RBIITD]